ncbi:MAG: hypothetical protein U0V54_05890 [Saprospiraceae bacterium]
MWWSTNINRRRICATIWHDSRYHQGCEWVAPYGEWYQWQGDGKNIVLTNTSAYVLNIKLFVGECGTLQCFYQQSLSPGDQ